MDHELKDVLMPLAIFGGLGGSIYFFTKVMTDYILKKKMIDKGYVNEDTQAIFKQHAAVDNRYSSLKWGLIILFAGLSLVVMEYVPTYGNSANGIFVDETHGGTLTLENRKEGRGCEALLRLPA